MNETHQQHVDSNQDLNKNSEEKEKNLNLIDSQTLISNYEIVSNVLPNVITPESSEFVIFSK